MRLSSYLCAIAMGVAAFTGVSAHAEPSILFDARTNQVIESEDAFARWYPASLTKLMTTYVAFSMIRSGEITLQSPIRMTAHAAKEPPSKMGYTPGSILTLDNALKILMVKSANDVAMAVGESLGGSQAAFAARMNQEAQHLGMTGSHWTNPNGLHDDNQYTTAHDLAVLASALRREFPQYASYFALDGIVAGKSRIPNHNTLIGRFEGADGMKTGYTCPSGYNLVGSATRDGRTLMAVVIGSKTVASRAEKAAGMLVRGFAAQTMGAPTLEQMTPSGDKIDQATNMYDQICSKEARAKIRKEEQARIAKDEDEDDAAAQKSVYLTPIKGPRQMVTVSLGGATGPVPKGVALAMAQEESAGVPLPSWRPDLPPPPGAEPMVQGDSGGAGQ